MSNIPVATPVNNYVPPPSMNPEYNNGQSPMVYPPQYQPPIQYQQPVQYHTQLYQQPIQQPVQQYQQPKPTVVYVYNNQPNHVNEQKKDDEDKNICFAFLSGICCCCLLDACF